MKNKLLFLFHSIKQSVVNKPLAFVLLFLVFFTTTICCSLPSRFAVSDIRDVNNREASLKFDIQLSKFIKNKNEIFACFEKKEEELNAYDKMYWSISLAQYNCDVKINDVDNKFVDVCVIFSKFRQDELASNDNICFIGEYEAKEYDIVEGDILQLYGIDFEVSKIYVGTSGVWIPYDTQVQSWYSFESPPDPFTGKTKVSEVGGGARGISHKELNNLNMRLMRFGCKRYDPAIIPLASSFILVVAMLIIGTVASTTILAYWLKCNNKKYATYKTLGCSPTMLAATMMIETLLLAILAVAFGVLFDFIISVTMAYEIIITGYEWLHYLMLIGGPLVSILIVTIIAVCKRAKAMPVNAKYNM